MNYVVNVIYESLLGLPRYVSYKSMFDIIPYGIDYLFMDIPMHHIKITEINNNWSVYQTKKKIETMAGYNHKHVFTKWNEA